ncbi:hypothetical protein C8R43DRAFT_1133692 [Mycena crocata]|nr:hypothetical protein C8R43DRAFT_1133692 [Mycena crocata]
MSTTTLDATTSPLPASASPCNPIQYSAVPQARFVGLQQRVINIHASAMPQNCNSISGVPGSEVRARVQGLTRRRPFKRMFNNTPPPYSIIDAFHFQVFTVQQRVNGLEASGISGEFGMYFSWQVPHYILTHSRVSTNEGNSPPTLLDHLHSHLRGRGRELAREEGAEVDGEKSIKRGGVSMEYRLYGMAWPNGLPRQAEFKFGWAGFDGLGLHWLGSAPIYTKVSHCK